MLCQLCLCWWVMWTIGSWQGWCYDTYGGTQLGFSELGWSCFKTVLVWSLTWIPISVWSALGKSLEEIYILSVIQKEHSFYGLTLSMAETNTSGGDWEILFKSTLIIWPMTLTFLCPYFFFLWKMNRDVPGNSWQILALCCRLEVMPPEHLNFSSSISTSETPR